MDAQDPWTLEHAIEIARIGAGDHEGYRSYDGTGGLWAGRNRGAADASFSDWGLARAVSVILNAVLAGRLVMLGDEKTYADVALSEENDRLIDALKPFAARVNDDASIVSGRIPDIDLRRARFVIDEKWAKLKHVQVGMKIAQD